MSDQPSYICGRAGFQQRGAGAKSCDFKRRFRPEALCGREQSFARKPGEAQSCLLKAVHASIRARRRPAAAPPAARRLRYKLRTTDRGPAMTHERVEDELVVPHVVIHDAAAIRNVVV